MIERIWELRVSPEFVDTLDLAIQWYDGNAPEVTDKFRTVVSNKLRSIKTMPESFQKCDHGRRLALLKPFPYSIVFRVTNSNMIEIIELVHSAKSWPI